MEKNEIVIGREVEKGSYLVYPVDKQYLSVGRKHARIIRKSDGIYIEDLGSAGGTFVNGTPVHKKKIHATDTIMLGGADYYELDCANVLKLLPMPDKEFQAKFLQLKKVYDDYQREKGKIQSQSQRKTILTRTVPMAFSTLLIGLLMIVVPFFFNKGNPMVSMIIQIFGSIISAFGLLLGGIWASNTTAKTPERLNELRERFLIAYVCPNCGLDFGERPWEIIKRQGKCQRCQREFHVE